MKKPLIIFFGVLACLNALSAPASAEWFADLFVGPAFTQSEDIVFKAPSLGFTARAKDVDFDNSVYFGGRVGHWFDSVSYVGFALDVSHFRPQIGHQTVTDCLSGLGCFSVPLFAMNLAVTGISFDALLRWPLLTSKEFPTGQLQPYLTIGPSIFVARLTDSSNFSPTSPTKHSDTDTSVGVKTGAGLAWQFHRNVALFGEYRFTHFVPEFTLRNTEFGNIHTTTHMNSHTAVFGVSFRLN